MRLKPLRETVLKLTPIQQGLLLHGEAETTNEAVVEFAIAKAMGATVTRTTSRFPKLSRRYNYIRSYSGR